MISCCGAVCVWFLNFMFGCRTATGSAMRASDVFGAVGSLFLRLEMEEQRTIELERWVLHVPLEFLAGPLALWQRWGQRRAALNSPMVGDALVWSLPSISASVRPRDLDSYYRVAVAAAGFRRPVRLCDFGLHRPARHGADGQVHRRAPGGNPVVGWLGH